MRAAGGLLIICPVKKALSALLCLAILHASSPVQADPSALEQAQGLSETDPSATPQAMDGNPQPVGDLHVHEEHADAAPAPAMTGRLRRRGAPQPPPAAVYAADEKKAEGGGNPTDREALYAMAGGAALGALIGFMLGGPIGAVVGLLAGALIGGIAAKLSGSEKRGKA